MLRRSFLKGVAFVSAASVLPNVAHALDTEKIEIYPNLTATVNNKGVKLVWDTTPNVMTCFIYRNENLIGITLGSNKFFDDNVKDLTEYTYTVILRYGDIALTTSSVSVTTPPSLNTVYNDMNTGELYYWNDDKNRWIK